MAEMLELSDKGFTVAVILCVCMCVYFKEQL